MEHHKRSFFAIILLVAGVVLVVTSEPQLTGAFAGAPDTPGYGVLLGIMMMLGAVFTAIAPPKERVPGFRKHTLDEVMSGNVSHRFDKSAVELGRRLFEAGKGKLPQGLKHDSDGQEALYKEIFTIAQAYLHQGEDVEGMDSFQRLHEMRQVAASGLGVDDATSYAVKSLSQGRNNGAYKIIFDNQSGQYVGLAKTDDRRGSQHIRWA